MTDHWIDELRQATEPPDAAVAELHARVLAATRRPVWPAWFAVAAAILIAMIWLGWSRPVETLALQTPPPPPAPEVHFTAHPVLARAAKPPKGAAWIRIETEDPNVVILLLTEGGSE